MKDCTQRLRQLYLPCARSRLLAPAPPCRGATTTCPILHRSTLIHMALLVIALEQMILLLHLHRCHHLFIHSTRSLGVIHILAQALTVTLAHTPNLNPKRITRMDDDLDRDKGIDAHVRSWSPNLNRCRCLTMDKARVLFYYLFLDQKV